MIRLPIDEQIPQILDELRKHRALVLVAEPGAGKTTRVPPAIINSGMLSGAQRKLVMLQPRRIAARAAAARIADENNWTLGQEVGYQVRFEKRMTDATPLRVMTEGILTRQLLDDPSLDGVGCVVLDEFHERSIHSDLAIALLNEVRQSLRDDLYVVVMSATLDAEPVAKFLGDCPILRVPGRVFPVDIEHVARGIEWLEDRITSVVLKQIPQIEGDTLIFLPGAEEIRRSQEQLSRQRELADFDILPLHGSLPFEEQQRAISPSRRRKIVLSTNIAETSLTIDGVRLVIDSGLSRQPSFDAERGLDSLNLRSISRASATQRAGRAGRTAAGKCVRLWTAQEHQQLDAFDRPEIARVDLAGTLLDMHAWGESDPAKFNWYEAPPRATLDSAEALLKMLGALDRAGKITALGKKMQNLPVHPRLARLMLAGESKLAATIAALLSEKDFFRRQYQERGAIGSSIVQSVSDLLVRWHAIEEAERVNFDRRRMDERIDAQGARAIVRARDQLNRLVRGHASIAGDEEDLVCQLSLLAYPDRVCKRRASDPKSGLMTGGVGVKLDPECSVMQGEFFVAIDARQDDRASARQAQVRIASRIDPAWLEELFPQSVVTETGVRFDPEKQRVVGYRVRKYLDLILSEDTSAEIDPHEASRILAQALLPRAAEIIATDEMAERFLCRVELLRKHMPENNWPSLDDEGMREVLERACAGKRNAADVSGRALLAALEERFTYPFDRLLDQHAPESLTVPTGNKIKLQYSRTQPPMLAVRLQELFGQTQTPRIANGRVPVVLHLLGPNYRVVQITEDLASFWKNTYELVRKDLRARYPKHSWPDNPLTAPPQAKGRPRG